MGIKELEVVKTQRLSHSNQPLTANTIARGVRGFEQPGFETLAMPKP